MLNENKNSSRIIYFDYLRVAATFLIMLLHVSSACWYGTNVFSKTWLVLNAYKSITDHAVLLFVMISGTLFLGRDIPIKRLYSKNILRIACAFVFWDLIYSIFSNYQWGVWAVIKGMVFSHYHLWFLPMILGLYICIPLLKKIAESEKIMRYFLLLSFIFTFFVPQAINLLSTFAGLADSALFGQLINRYQELNIHMVVGYTFYFVLGYYVHKTDFSKKSRIIIYIMGLLGLIMSFVLSTAESRLLNVSSDTYHLNFSISVMLKVLATFVLFKSIIRSDIPGESRFRSIIFALSKYSFGAYLVHALIIEELYNIFNINVLSFNPVFSAVILTSGVFVVSFTISFLLNKIPFINKFIV